MMQQVQPKKETEKRDFNLKFRRYSESVLGYRINIHGEFHYILNELHMGEIDNIFNALISIDSSYDNYGFILLQEDYEWHIDYGYKYNNAVGRCIHDTSDKIIDINRYKYTVENHVKNLQNGWGYNG